MAGMDSLGGGAGKGSSPDVQTARPLVGLAVWVLGRAIRNPFVCNKVKPVPCGMWFALIEIAVWCMGPIYVLGSLLTGMRIRLIGLGAVATLYMAVVGFVGVAPVGAQERLSGEYRCVRVETEGRSERCQSPNLTLNTNGSYKIWGEQGTYEVVQGEWLVLSHSKRRGLGHVVNASEIVFEYHIDKKSCRVTFRRVYDPPTGMRFS
jgi:hypothetical protein